MATISGLHNFPFRSLEELSLAFNQGKAEPVVPVDFSREWATRSPQSSVKLPVSFCFGMTFIAVIGMIIFSIYSQQIRWFHVFGVAGGALTIFTPMSKSTFGKWPRKLVIYLTFGLTVYFFISGKNHFGYLFLLSIAILFFYEFTYFLALREIVAKILSDEDLLSTLWEKGIMCVRFTDGRICNVKGMLNTTIP